MEKALTWLKQVRWVRVEVWAIIGFSFTLVLLLMGVILSDSGSPSDVMLFFGRFHPVIVHLPIGMLLLAGILELVSARVHTFRVLRHATAFVLYLGAIGAALAVCAGLLLSMEGGYDPDLLSTHKWIGIAVASGAIVAACLRVVLDRKKGARLVYRVYATVLAATVTLLLVAGHLGGSLTHGPTYLTQYMPGPLKLVLGDLAPASGRYDIANVDSAHVFDDLVQPIFDRRCVDCHGPTKTKGRLRLDTREGLQEGGESGQVISPGSPPGSDLLRRVTLPLDHEDVMPPDGEQPLTVGETEMIRWWIANGASFDQQVADIEEVPTAVETALIRIAGPRPEEKSILYTFEVEPADSTLIAGLEESGFRVRKVAHDLNLLEIGVEAGRTRVSDEAFERLASLAEQVAWLDLSRSGVTNADLGVVSDMPHLNRLYLQFTPVSDAGVRHLEGLSHLEYVNLYGTSITDAALDDLAALPSLSAVYLWQTDVTEAALEDFQQMRPNVRAYLGSELAQDAEGSSATASSDSR